LEAVSETGGDAGGEDSTALLSEFSLGFTGATSVMAAGAGVADAISFSGAGAGCACADGDAATGG